MENFSVTRNDFDANPAADKLTVEENGHATLELNLDPGGKAAETKTFTISGLNTSSKITGIEGETGNIKLVTSDGSQYEIDITGFKEKYTPDMPVTARYLGMVEQSTVRIPTRGRSSGSSGYGSGGGNFGTKGDGGLSFNINSGSTSDVLITIPTTAGHKEYMHGVISTSDAIKKSPSFAIVPDAKVEIISEDGRKYSMQVYVRKFDLDEFESLKASAALLHQKPAFKIENHGEASLGDEKVSMPRGYVAEATRQFETALIPKIRYAYSRYLTETRDMNRIAIDLYIHFQDDGSCTVTFANDVDQRLQGAVKDAAQYLSYPQLSKEPPIHYEFNLVPPTE